MIVYVLELEDNKFFIGSMASNAAGCSPITFEYVMQECKDEMSTIEWLRTYAPIQLEEVRNKSNPYDEVKCMLEYMDDYGIQNVRCSAMSNVELGPGDMDLLRKLVYIPVGKCSTCGSSKHSVQGCSYARWNQLLNACFICQSASHHSAECPLRVPSSTPQPASYESIKAFSDTPPPPMRRQRSYATAIFDRIYDWLFDRSNRPRPPPCCAENDDGDAEMEEREGRADIRRYYTYDGSQTWGVDDYEHDNAAFVDREDYVCTTTPCE